MMRKPLTIQPSRQVVSLIDVMVASGLYGRSREACVDELLRRAVRDEEVRLRLVADRKK